MAKKAKAIELVFRAQPAMALLHQIMKEQNMDDRFVKDIGDWLEDARNILRVKDSRK